MRAWAQHMDCIKANLRALNPWSPGSAARRLSVGMALVLITPVALIARLAGVRFLGVGLEDRIGHLVAEPYYAACLRMTAPRAYRLLILTYDPKAVAYVPFLKALPSYFKWIRNRPLRNLARPLQRHPLSNIDMNTGVRTATGEAEIFDLLARRSRPKSFLSFSEEGIGSASDMLKRLGISERNWYVILHNREGGTFAGRDVMHEYRNGSIDDFYSVIDRILIQGGAVVRIGDPSMTPLAPHDGVADCTRQPDLLARYQLHLFRHASLFIGSTSGPIMLAGVEGIPIAAVNLAPMGASLVFDDLAVCVPKIYVDRSTGFEIPFTEIFGSSLADMRDSQSLDNAGVWLKDSDADVIVGAVEEALGLSPYAQLTDWDHSAQRVFRSLFREGNYSHFSPSRISTAFLRKYSHLLDTPGTDSVVEVEEW